MARAVGQADACTIAQCTEAANKARILIFTIRYSFEIGFHPIIRGLSASTPRTWYARVVAKPRGRYQSFRANSKISYTVGNWHSSPPLQRETTAATTSGRLDYRIQDIHGSLRC